MTEATGTPPELPKRLQALLDLPERHIVIPNDKAAVEAYLDLPRPHRAGGRLMGAGMANGGRLAGDVQVTTLDNGARVITDRMEGVASASVGAWFGVGTRNEAAEANGVAHLLEHMAFKGTKRRSPAAIAEEIEAVGGHLNAYTSREQTAYYARVLGQDADLAIDLISDILVNSTFDETELARERSVILQEIGQSEDTPDDIIFDNFQEAAFPNQPIGRPVLGRSEIIRDMKRGVVTDFIGRSYAGDTMVFAAAGDVNHDRLVDAVAKSFDGLPSKASVETEGAEYVGGEFREDRDLEQVHFILGFRGAVQRPGLPRDPDAVHGTGRGHVLAPVPRGTGEAGPRLFGLFLHGLLSRRRAVRDLRGDRGGRDPRGGRRHHRDPRRDREQPQR